jgi:spore maturation protein CgeB
LSSRAELILVGNAGGTNVGASLYRAAERLGLTAHLCNSHEAHGGPKPIAQLTWRFLGRRPASLKSFGRKVVEACKLHSPRALLTTGLAPVDAGSLAEIGRMGIPTLNYLTDDPWNPTQRSRWFFRAVPRYDHVFSPRQANLEDLRNAGCIRVHYLPFAYDEELFFTGHPPARDRAEYDLVFAGGADIDRIPYATALLQTGTRVALIGDYWDRFQATRGYCLGHLVPTELRHITAVSRAAICLVRRANRDGHVMRSFEIPAIGTCMLAEDTPEHRAIFGEDRSAVAYFRTPHEMTEKATWILANESERLRMAQTAHRLITEGGNTYQDRLKAMLQSI